MKKLKGKIKKKINFINYLKKILFLISNFYFSWKNKVLLRYQTLLVFFLI